MSISLQMGIHLMKLFLRVLESKPVLNKILIEYRDSGRKFKEESPQAGKNYIPLTFRTQEKSSGVFHCVEK
jgi:hypothetical protein